ncbi:MAG: RraA family protein [Planctomycetota bacterium]|nr:RraA family protein [Planctomycetota bacterium]
MSEPAAITLAMMREHLYSAVVCDALDALGFPRQAADAPLRPWTGATRLVGRCRTTRWEDLEGPDPRPYELELRAVDACRPGEVLICAASGSLKSGIWGELLSTAARNQGCAGALVDGAVRDVARMRELGFPVWARGTSPRDSQHRQRVVELDANVVIGGVTFEPGALVFADEDGIVAVPRAVEADAIRRAWEKVHAENITRQAIRDGMKAGEAWATYGVL